MNNSIFVIMIKILIIITSLLGIFGLAGMSAIVIFIFNIEVYLRQRLRFLR